MFLKLREEIRVMMPVIYIFLSCVVVSSFLLGEYGYNWSCDLLSLLFYSIQTWELECDSSMFHVTWCLGL